MKQNEGGGWTSPQTITAGIGILSIIVGSYLSTQRDDSADVRERLENHASRVAVMEMRLEYLANELREQRQRPDRQRD